jgi:hypothetical protein
MPQALLWGFSTPQWFQICRNIGDIITSSLALTPSLTFHPTNQEHPENSLWDVSQI